MNLPPFSSQLHQIMSRLTLVNGYAQLIERRLRHLDVDDPDLQRQMKQLRIQIKRLIEDIGELREDLSHNERGFGEPPDAP